MKSVISSKNLNSFKNSFESTNSETSLIIPSTVLKNPNDQIPSFRQDYEAEDECCEQLKNQPPLAKEDSIHDDLFAHDSSLISHKPTNGKNAQNPETINNAIGGRKTSHRADKFRIETASENSHQSHGAEQSKHAQKTEYKNSESFGREGSSDKESLLHYECFAFCGSDVEMNSFDHSTSSAKPNDKIAESDLKPDQINIKIEESSENDVKTGSISAYDCQKRNFSRVGDDCKINEDKVIESYSSFKPIKVRVSSGDVSRSKLDPLNPLTPLAPMITPPFVNPETSKNATHSWVLPSPAVTNSGLDPHSLLFQFDTNDARDFGFRRSESVSPTTPVMISSTMQESEQGVFDFEKVVETSTRASSNTRSRLVNSTSVASSTIASVPQLEISLSEGDSYNSIDENSNLTSGKNETSVSIPVKPTTSVRRLKSPSVSFKTADGGGSFDLDTTQRNPTTLSSSANSGLSTSISCFNSLYECSRDELIDSASNNLSARSAAPTTFSEYPRSARDGSFRKLATISLENQSSDLTSPSRKTSLNYTPKCQFLNPVPSHLDVYAFDGSKSGGSFMNPNRRSNSTIELNSQNDYPPECSLEEMAQKCVDGFGKADYFTYCSIKPVIIISDLLIFPLN